MKDWRKEPRRRHSEELKAQVLAECAQPGASVAAVALAHSLCGADSRDEAYDRSKSHPAKQLRAPFGKSMSMPDEVLAVEPEP